MFAQRISPGPAAFLILALPALAAAQPESRWDTYDFVPGNAVLLATDYGNAPLGRFPSDQLRYQEGSAQIVEQAGKRVLEFTDQTRFLIDLPAELPEDFTLEFEARTGAPNMRIEVFFTPREVRTSAYEHPYLSIWRDAGIALKGRSISSTDSYREIAERMVAVRLRVEGEYATLYLDDVRAANVPTVAIPRSSTVEFEIAANRGNPAYLGEIEVAAGGGILDEEFATSGMFTSRGVLFADDSDVLRPESTPVLESIRRALEQTADLSIAVEDHTAEDMDLSQSRAESIVNFLVERGIAAERMTAVGKGGSEPVVEGDSRKERLENRRVVIVRREG